MKFKRLTPKQYQDSGTFKMDSIDSSIKEISSKIGEPRRYNDANFPDDEDKVDVCWGIKNSNKDVVLIWNYKNGHYEGIDLEENDLLSFSVSYSNEDFFKEFKKEMGIE